MMTDIQKLVRSQKRFFNKGKTKNIRFPIDTIISFRKGSH